MQPIHRWVVRMGLACMGLPSTGLAWARLARTKAAGPSLRRC